MDNASVDTLNQQRFLSLRVSLCPFFGSVASPSVFFFCEGNDRNQCAKSQLRTYNLACRWSLRTTHIDGIGPSPPPFDLCSNSDAANARAAVQASIVDHRSRQACSALFRRTGVSERARAAARRRRKVEVSADQRPPTSPTKTTNFALLLGPTNSRYVRSVGGPPQEQFHRPSQPTLMSRNQCRVHCKLCPAEQREAFRNNFSAAPIVHLWCQDIQITHMHVGRNASASLTANSCANALNCKPRLPRTPALLHAARWWPNESSGRPHRQVRETKGKGKWRRRSKSTRNKWGSILVASCDGVPINATPANGPLWDRNVACSFSLNRLRRNSRCRRSTVEDASCCHPRFAQPGSYSSMSRRSGHKSTIILATMGCRARIMANESAQLAQKAKALVRAALRRPNPPMHNGKDATSLVNSSH